MSLLIAWLLAATKRREMPLVRLPVGAVFVVGIHAGRVDWRSAHLAMIGGLARRGRVPGRRRVRVRVRVGERA